MSQKSKPGRLLLGPTLAVAAVAAFVGAALGAAQGVSAQSAPAGPAWLSDRTRVEGRGIRAGRLELHPGIGAELGYDSNVYLSSGGADGAIEDSFILRGTLHFYVSTLGAERQGDDERRRPQQVRFRGGASASYYEYFAFPEQRNVSADLSLRLDLAPESTWNFSLFEDFSRGVRPFTNGGVDTAYARDRNRVGAELGFAPHGGVLEYRLGYALAADLFEEDDFTSYNNLGHEIFLRGRWRFLPKTAISYEGNVTVRSYLEEVGALTARSDSVTVSARLGLVGLVSTRVSINLAVGYLAGFYQGDIGNDLENVTATAEVQWAYSPFGRIRLGYLRDSQNAYFGNFVHRDQGSLSWSHLIAGRVLVSLDGSAAFVQFDDTLYAPDPRDPTTTIPVNNRSDIQIRGALGVEYRATDWLGFTLSGAYTSNITDFQYYLPGGMAGELAPDPGEYQKFEGWLGVRASY